MSLVVRAFPLRGNKASLDSFIAQLNGERAAQAEQFYKHFGVSHESWHLQETPNGPWVIAITSLENPGEAAPQFAASEQDFHVWFKNQVLSLTGVDPSTTPLGPPTTEVFSWPVSSQRVMAL